MEAQMCIQILTEEFRLDFVGICIGYGCDHIAACKAALEHVSIFHTLLQN